MCIKLELPLPVCEKEALTSRVTVGCLKLPHEQLAIIFLRKKNKTLLLWDLPHDKRPTGAYAYTTICWESFDHVFNIQITTNWHFVTFLLLMIDLKISIHIKVPHDRIREINVSFSLALNTFVGLSKHDNRLSKV